MKQLFIIVMMLISSIAAIAQQSDQDVRDRMVEIKTRYLIRTLKISQVQQKRFIEIYRRYNKNMRGMWTFDNSNNKSENTMTQAQHIKQRLEKQKRAIDVQIAVIDELAQVLNADQLSRFLDVERKIQKHVKARRDQIAKSRGLQGQHQPSQRH